MCFIVKKVLKNLGKMNLIKDERRKNKLKVHNPSTCLRNALLATTGNLSLPIIHYDINFSTDTK